MEFHKENSLIANIPDYIQIESKKDQSECSCELASISLEIEYNRNKKHLKILIQHFKDIFYIKMHELYY